jgi:hypothetical protein
LSGLEAGERTASFFQQQEELLHKQWKEPSEHHHLSWLNTVVSWPGIAYQ